MANEYVEHEPLSSYGGEDASRLAGWWMKAQDQTG
jgi:hypothetical protein